MVLSTIRITINSHCVKKAKSTTDAQWQTNSPPTLRKITDLSEDLLYRSIKWPEDGESKGGLFEAVGKASLSFLAMLGLLNNVN